MTEQDRIGLFDRWSETYDRGVLDESGVHEGYDEVLETVVRLAEARPEMCVLDLGIGIEVCDSFESARHVHVASVIEDHTFNADFVAQSGY